ncbi:hypothetical protein MRB53_009464 [Persea americana]|uniref:Uncharacterized protein n=1 Tax=Persea americana TaxID=3435 RepID=A0ACC2LP82_PERAE|nr:hypothetical protein MRB53_009464 [Persea americana]
MMDRGEMGAWEEDDGDNGGVLREGNEWREEGWRAMVLEMGSLGSAAWDHVLPLLVSVSSSSKSSTVVFFIHSGATAPILSEVDNRVPLFLLCNITEATHLSINRNDK